MIGHVSSTPNFESVRIDVAGQVAEVVLDRPPVNAINTAMFAEIKSAFDWVSGNEDLAVAVLRSDAKHFCAGTDLHDFEAMTPQSAEKRNAVVRQAFWSIHDCAVPVIGAVHGVCVGSGVALAAVCDFVIASSDAQFGVPELSVGVMGGARHLARLLPEAVMRRLFYTSARVGADVLAQYGGVTEIVEREALHARARELAEDFAGRSASVLRVAKMTLNTVEYLPLKEGYAYEQSQTARLSADRQARDNLAQTMSSIGRD